MASSKRFTLHTLLAVASLLAVTSLLAIMLWQRMWMESIPVWVAWVWCLLLCWRQVRFPLLQMSYFLGALNNKDLMIRFPKTRDPLVGQMYVDMNRIISLYWADQHEVDTRKLYYERLLRIITHEIRNTITPIVSLSADLLEHEADYPYEKRHEEMEIIHQQTQYIIQFLESYHQLTHVPQPVCTQVAVKPLLQRLLSLLERETEGVSVKVSVAENMTIKADGNLITLVLLNLLRNSLQALKEQPDGIIEIIASNPDRQPVISIQDNGPGIPPKLIESIFLPFFTTKKEGSGIGLCLSRQIMRLHDGDLTVVSQPGKITTFSLIFPK